MDSVTELTPDYPWRVPVPSDVAAQLLLISARLKADTAERDRLIVEAHKAGASLREIEKVAGITYGGVLKIIRKAAG